MATPCIHALHNFLALPSFQSFNHSIKEHKVNIFILSEQLDPAAHHEQNAQFHCDKHVIKMIAESVQMLVTSLATRQYSELGIYLPASIVDNLPCKPLGLSMSKHPCVEWVKQDIKHFNYLALLAWHLCIEHQYRYPLSAEHAYAAWLADLVNFLEVQGLAYSCPIPDNFAVAVKSVGLRSTSTPHIEALNIYRGYYFEDKQGFATWKKRQKPVWWLLLEEAEAS
jgi:hypothetical protein